MIIMSPMGPGFFIFFQTPSGGNEKGQKLEEFGGPPMFPREKLDEFIDDDVVISLSLLIERCF